MNSIKANWKPLDVIFILLGALTIVLLVFWVASQLGGEEQLAELPLWIQNMADKFWTFLISGTAAALTQWLNSSRSDGPNYLLWIGVSTVFFVGMIYGVQKIFFSTPSSEIEIAKLNLKIPFSNRNVQSVEFIQMAPKRRQEKNYAIQKNGYYEIDIDLPQMENTFVSKVAPLISDSELSGTIVRDLFFTRAKNCAAPHHLNIELTKDNKIVALGDLDGQSQCDVGIKAISENHLHGFIHFASIHQNENLAWNVPRLENLIKYHQNKKGYSLFKLTLSNQENVLKETYDHYTYEVFVNGTQVRFNGFLPQDLIYPYNRSIVIEFGLQSLNFSGAYASDLMGDAAGYEKIVVRVNLRNESGVSLQEYVIPNEYVAFRSFTDTLITSKKGLKVNWSASFQSALSNEYEVFVASSTDGNAIKSLKESIDQRQLTFDNKVIRAVVRPPLRSKNNQNFGIILGLEQESKQIDVTFNHPEAQALLAWIIADENVQHFRKDAYLFHVDGQIQ